MCTCLLFCVYTYFVFYAEIDKYSSINWPNVHDSDEFLEYYRNGTSGDGLGRRYKSKLKYVGFNFGIEQDDGTIVYHPLTSYDTMYIYIYRYI